MTDIEMTAERPAESQFLVHFMLRDGSHSMDASVLHSCDGELLNLIKEVGRQLDVELRVETRAVGEGGIQVFLTLVGKHAPALTLISGCIASIVGGAAWWVYQSPLLTQQAALNEFTMQRDKKLSEQQVQLNELNLKKARIELKRLEEEDAANAPKAPATGASARLPLEPPPKVDDVVPSLLLAKKVLKHRSQFYAALLSYEKVTAVGYAQTHTPTSSEELVVRREIFSSFIVVPTELEPLVYRNAEIEIVSPVLARGSFKWRGLFEGRPIAFDLADEHFMARVTGKRVKFQHGSSLICELRVNQRENESGAAEPYEYIVERVHKQRSKPSAASNAKLTAPQGKKPEGTMDSFAPSATSGDQFSLGLGGPSPAE